MIVCLCHRVSERDIQAAVRTGTACFEVLQDELRVASSCGSCHDCAREVFDHACQGRHLDRAGLPACGLTARA
jgi:bacterioferritin-associated ferredoxin